MPANSLITMTTHLRNVFLVLTIGLLNTVYTDLSVAAEADIAENQAAPTIVIPIAPQKMLENIKAAVERGAYLNNDFYTPENLHDFFGDPYTFKPLIIPSELNIRVFSFDSVASPTVDQSKVTSIQRKVLPVFSGGKIYLTDLIGNQVIAHFVIEVNVAIAKPDFLNADLVQQVFGAPTSVTSVKSAASKDDQTTQEIDTSSPVGNRWLNYQTEKGDIFKNILFKSAADGAVTEMQIYVGKKL